MPTNNPLVSFITINYINIEETIAFLESAQKVTYPNIELIVVDNDSPTGKPTPEIKERFPNVHFIQSEKNLGFAGGNNLGIKVAKGEFILLVNNDVEVTPDFLQPMTKLLADNPEIGIISPKIVFHERENRIQYAGAIQINPFTGRGKKIGYLEVDAGQYNFAKRTQLAHGACFMIKKEVINKIGLMPELFFLYYEEHDWTESAKRLGYQVYFQGNSTVYHKESASTGKDSPLKTYYLTRNHILFLRRNLKGVRSFLPISFFLIILFPKMMINFAVKGNWSNVKSGIQGLFWNFNHFKT